MSSTRRDYEFVAQPECGNTLGLCKWFDQMKGFGFIRVVDGEHRNTDVFVHHSGVKPHNNSFRILNSGEYVSMNLVNSEKGLQAVDVRGVRGGPLMCDDYTYQMRYLNRLRSQTRTTESSHEHQQEESRE